MDKSCVFKTDLLLLVHFESDVVGAILDNFIILLEFLVILWNDPNYLLDLFRMSAFLFLLNRFGLLVMKLR